MSVVRSKSDFFVAKQLFLAASTSVEKKKGLREMMKSAFDKIDWLDILSLEKTSSQQAHVLEALDVFAKNNAWGFPEWEYVCYFCLDGVTAHALKHMEEAATEPVHFLILINHLKKLSQTRGVRKRSFAAREKFFKITQQKGVDPKLVEEHVDDIFVSRYLLTRMREQRKLRQAQKSCLHITLNPQH